MLNVLSITAPIFLLIWLGYAAVSSGLMAKDATRPLGAFVVTFALPALIVHALAGRPIAGIVSPGYLAAYGGGSLAAYFLLFGLARWQGKTQTAAAIHALGGAGSNSAFLGYPLVSLALGPVAITALTQNMLIELLILLPLALGLAEGGLKGGGSPRGVLHAIATRLLKNPLIIAICAGMAVSLTGLPLPGPLTKAFDLLGASAAPVALFVVGGTLAELPLGGLVGDASQIAFTKLAVHPAAVFAFLQLVPPLPADLDRAALLYAALPVAALYPLVAQPYGRAQQAAAALALGTAASFLTISVFLAIV